MQVEDRAGGRVVVVGCGAWGRNHVRNYAQLGALAGVVDARAEVAREFAARHGTRALSYEEALADPDVAGIVLAVPPSRNAALGIQALEAGKHLFVEKPMAMVVEDGEAMARLAEERGRHLMVGHILHYHPAFQALSQLVAQGRLGPLMSIVSTRLDFGRIRREEDVLWDLAPHDISIVQTLVGAEPEAVAASGGYHTHPAIADNAQLQLGFADGIRAEIRVSWLHPFKEQRLVVVGQNGMAVFDDREPWDGKLVVYPHRVVQADGGPLADKGEPETIAVAAAEPLREQCRHFLDCIATGGRPRTDGREGLRVLRTLERASTDMRRTATSDRAA